MEYSNDSLDYSIEGLANECVEFVEEMQRNLSAAPNTKIKQELKADINVNLESLKKKLNQLASMGS
jgi:hypothetical protein